MEEKEKNEITLEVEESPIKGEDGVGRIHDNVLKQLGVEEGKSISVSFEEKAILLTIYADKIIDKAKISIREGDREKLGVSSGDKVILNPHKTLQETLKDTKEAAKEKLGIEDEEEEEKQ